MVENDRVILIKECRNFNFIFIIIVKLKRHYTADAGIKVKRVSLVRILIIFVPRSRVHLKVLTAKRT